ncbi:DUF4868 domain-containing protein [Fusobacterium necrophorum]|uniref:Kiwa anti-phage protein KwaB-like domain-containing protein n=1 Tax=Fusobacterium necrophorum TaxID=859 RepID=UPI00255033DD|nr:Kiwa anti-phage protein KwaB-like domain-containing protein [Fusobacterium necrophorum]MDK4472286.1 DUF4868 domain-containing protein [Fusobacterium necrophorum]MDK4518007.1 DUF4868 domain-containing protein [Fusobacterium necrophorum]
MDLRAIIQYLGQENLVYDMYFSRKLKSGYESFSPNIDNQIFEDVLNLILDNLNIYVSLEQTSYNPTGYRDGTVEICDVEYVGNYEDILQSFIIADNVETEIDPDNFSFYCFTIKNKEGIGEEFEIKFFRRVTKFKKLSTRGILARFSGNRLNKMESKVIGLDGDIDLIVFNGQILTLSHFSLERIFSLQDKFMDNAEQFLEKIAEKPLIQNFDDFKIDCLHDARFTKILTKMSDESIDMSLLIERFDYIKKTIDMFELPIEIEEGDTPKIIYSDKSQIYDILRILRDCYYISLIKQEKGVDNKI